MNPLLPDVAVHGTWVRSLVHDGFGRLCWRVTDRTYFGQIEFFVMWEGPDEDMGTKGPTGGYHEAKDLDVRPYQPRPWIENPPIETKYRYWAEEIERKKRDGDRQL